MKKTIPILVAALLTLVACEPDGRFDLDTERDITYTVAPATAATDNNTSTTVHLKTEAEWQELLDRFCDYAEGGSTVTFHDANRTAKGIATKEATTFSTTSREEMKAWMARMEDKGMTVTITYDPATGTWSGTAYATAPQPPLPSGGLVTYEYDGMNDMGYIWSFDTVNRRVYITLHYTIQNIIAPDYPDGVYEYRHADEVNTPFAYWFIDSWGDTAGLYNLETIGSDTLHFNSTKLGNPVTLVRTDSWHTYLWSKHGINIAMHVCGNPMEGYPYIEVYPEVYIGQMGVNGIGRVDFIWPYGIGRFVMLRTDMVQSARGIPYWGLTLDYRPFGGTDTIGDLFIQGEPLTDSQIAISTAGGSEFVFLRL